MRTSLARHQQNWPCTCHCRYQRRALQLLLWPSFQEEKDRKSVDKTQVQRKRAPASSSPPTHTPATTTHPPTNTHSRAPQKNTQTFSNRCFSRKIFWRKTGLCVYKLKNTGSTNFCAQFPGGKLQISHGKTGLCNTCLKKCVCVCVFFCLRAPHHNAPQRATTRHTATQPRERNQTQPNQTKRKKKKEKKKVKEKKRKGEREKERRD